MKTVAIVQARMGSMRFPGKVMKPILGASLIELLLHRLSLAKRIDSIVLATTKQHVDDALTEHVQSLGYDVFRGDEKDVLDRYYRAAKIATADVIVRITGDCPLVDPELVDQVIDAFDSETADYISNANPPTFADGLDVEVFTLAALESAWRNAQIGPQREHVTPYIRESNRFRCRNIVNTRDDSGERWTVDERADFQVVEGVFKYFHPRRDFSWRDVFKLLQSQPQLFVANRDLIRNQGAVMSTGQKLWKRAKHVIPGGNMLLSKRAEMFLPEYWPTYFSKAKGCRVWDLDGNEYVDMSIMGIGTNILGYGHPAVDDAVHKTIEAGNMSTLNCPEEVFLAERLVEMHPWAEMVRFARSGGEANAVAVRIARAASGKDKVAICGYHGWHDWYLAANLSDDKHLEGHLLPGLQPKGVPADLLGSVFPFSYNRIDELEDIVSAHNVGVIIMEVSRNFGPADGFLETVRRIATDRGIVLIFDECTSGFRQSFGGLHKLFGVEPDMAMFGKALGNGYAINAVIGRRDVMEAAQSSFISSTFWTERIGPSAALKTLEVMQSLNSWDQITATGKDIFSRWKSLADKYKLSISTSGLPALANFTFNSARAMEYKTLITQEMLARGYLAGTSIYVSTEHTLAIVGRFFEDLDPVFSLIRECEDGRDINTLLKGPVCHAGFKRLN